MKNSKRALALLLCAALLLGALSACGGGSDTPEATDPSALVWTSSFSSLSGLGENVNYISGVAYSGGAIYMAAQTYDPETYESANVFKRYDVASGEISDLSGYAPVSLPEAEAAENSYTSLNQICAGPDGGLWVIEDVNYTVFNLPEGFAGTEEERWNYAEYMDACFLRLLSADGSELVSVDLASIAEGQDYFYVSNMASDGEGNVYIVDQNNGFWVYAPDGTQLYGSAPSSGGAVPSINYINRMITLGDGRVAVMGYDDVAAGNVLKPFDLSTNSFGESITMPGNAYNIYPGSGDYLFYYINASNMYGYNASTGEGTELFNLISCDIDEDTLSAFVAEGDGYVCLTAGYGNTPNSEYTMELATVRQVEASSLPQKTTLTLAALYLSSDLRADILNFNRSSDQYRIEVTDYSEFNTEDDYTAGLTRLSTEIISGRVPDILAASGLPMQQYVSRGLLEDLYPYLDADGEISRDDLFTSVLSAMEINGGLYQASSSFSVQTMAGKSSVVGSEPGWTVEELMDIYNSQPEGTLLLSNTSSTVVLSMMMQNSLNDYVDWANATCSFNDQSFIDLLEFCAQFPAEYSYDENAPSEPSLIQSGQQMLYSMYMYDFNEIQFVEAMFGDELCIKGYPTPEGVGNFANVVDGLSISATCADKEGAWSFVRQVFTEEYSDSHWSFGFPINRAAYQKQLDEAMTPSYYTDPETGEQVEQSMGGMGYDDFMVDFYATTQEEADMIQAVIDSISGTVSYDTNIMTIVNEEAAGLFSGQRTAEQVADVIQNRVSTYVAEQA